jgi:fatty-acyl-CoA synthase
MSALPKLASMKIDKERLRHEAWRVDQVFWRPNRNEPLREVDESARRRLDPLLG